MLSSTGKSPGIVILVTLLQSINAELLKLSMLSGKMMLVRLTHPLNALSPIITASSSPPSVLCVVLETLPLTLVEVELFKNVTDVSSVQFSNALSPTSFTDEGKTMLVMAELSLKISELTSTTPSGTVRSVSAPLYARATF